MLAAWLFAAKTFLLRRAFFAGKASFLLAEIEATQNVPAGGRLLSHYRLATGRLRRGTHGWAELSSRLRSSSRDFVAALRCRSCGHRYVIVVPRAADPLALPLAPGGSAGYPASFSADWFRFWHPEQPGEPSLDCPTCEESGAPAVRLL